MKELKERFNKLFETVESGRYVNCTITPELKVFTDTYGIAFEYKGIDSPDYTSINFYRAGDKLIRINTSSFELERVLKEIDSLVTEHEETILTAFEASKKARLLELKNKKKEIENELKQLEDEN